MKKIFFIYLVNIFFMNSILFAEEEANLISNQTETQNSQLNKYNNQEKKHSIFIGLTSIIQASNEIKQDIINENISSSYLLDINDSVGYGATIGYNYAFLPRFRVGLEVSIIGKGVENIKMYDIWSVKLEESYIYSAKAISQNKIMSTYEFDLFKGKKVELFINTGIGFSIDKLSNTQKVTSTEYANRNDETFVIPAGESEDLLEGDDLLRFCMRSRSGGARTFFGYEGGGSITSIPNSNSNTIRVTLGSDLTCYATSGSSEPTSIDSQEEEIITTVSSIPISFGLGMNYKFTKSFIWQFKAGYTNNTTISTETTFKNKVKTEVDFGNQSYTDITTGLVWRF